MSDQNERAESDPGSDESSTTVETPPASVDTGGSGSAGPPDRSSVSVDSVVARPSNPLSVGTLVISLLALGIAGYAWYQTEVRDRLSTVEQNFRIGKLESRVDDFGSGNSDIDVQLDRVRERLVTIQTQVEDQGRLLGELLEAGDSGLEQQIRSVAERSAEIESGLHEQLASLRRDVETDRENLDAELDRIRAKLDVRDDSVEKEFEELLASIRALRSEFSSNSRIWILRQVENLLNMADQRIRLTGDARSALVLLESAEQMMQKLNAPTFSPVLESIRSAIGVLKEVHAPDLDDILDTLTELSRNLEGLPMLGGMMIADTGMSGTTSGESVPEEERNSETFYEGVVSIGRSFLSDMGNLVQVEITDEPIIPPLTPEIRHLVEERGRLMLENAQVALMRQDGRRYQESLDLVEKWVRERYEETHERTVEWLEDLSEARMFMPGQDLPDISAPLHMLRDLMKSGS